MTDDFYKMSYCAIICIIDAINSDSYKHVDDLKIDEVRLTF